MLEQTICSNVHRNYVLKHGLSINNIVFVLGYKCSIVMMILGTGTVHKKKYKKSKNLLLFIIIYLYYCSIIIDYLLLKKKKTSSTAPPPAVDR